MNKKYIDFVPSSRVGAGARRVASPRRRVVRKVKEEDVVVVMPNVEPDKGRLAQRGGAVYNDLPQNDAPRHEESQNDSFSIETSLRLGVVEDYNPNPKFVNTDVPKRPLHNESTEYTTIAEVSHVEGQDSDIAEVKSRKVKRKFFGGSDEAKATRDKSKKDAASQSTAKSMASVNSAKASQVAKDNKSGSVGAGGKSKGGTFVPPRSPFINQEKIVKRPLSSKNVYQETVSTKKEEPKGPVAIISNSEKESKVGLLVTIILTIILGAVAGTVAFLLLPK